MPRGRHGHVRTHAQYIRTQRECLTDNNKFRLLETYFSIEQSHYASRFVPLHSVSSA